MKSFFKRENGFTLVELMVVVAIIGLLSAVAVPNFKKYQAKAKTSEAKLQLSALYTAEQSFFSDFAIYSNCLVYMGFNPTAEKANRYYGVGFAAEMASTINATAWTAAINSGLNDDFDYGCPNETTMYDASDVNPAPRSAWFPAGKGVGSFVIGAAASVDTYNSAASIVTCTLTNLRLSNSVGTCVGSQAGAETMAFQAAAIGYISKTGLPSNASGFNINQDKVIKAVIPGY